MPEQQHDPDLGTRVTALNDQLLSYARDLRTTLARTAQTAAELSRSHLETVAALATAIDVRDEVTGGHVYRVANYGRILAQQVDAELASDPQLVFGFLLHDIGKLAVPDRVLSKTGPLDADEEALMRAHVAHGVGFIERIAFLRPALEVVATHHERWDGGGYPNGLRGPEIPLVSRLFSICDAFDAMIHDRPYRPAMAPDAAFDELRRGAATQFDPAVVDAFAEVVPDLVAVEARPELPHVGARGIAPMRELSLTSTEVFDVLDEGLLLISVDGVVLDANRAFLELLGLPQTPVGTTLHELIDRYADRFADPMVRADAARLVRDLFAGRDETTVQLVTPPRVLRRSARTIIDERGNTIARLLVFRDVTWASRPHAVASHQRPA